jgi:hypothetical protein
VFFPYTPWDIGTNTSSEETPAGQLAVLLGDTDADGYNGDTMSGIPFQDFYTLAAEALGRVPYLEPEQVRTTTTVVVVVVVVAADYYFDTRR